MTDQPFAQFAPAIRQPTPLRQAITAAYRRDEAEALALRAKAKADRLLRGQLRKEKAEATKKNNDEDRKALVDKLSDVEVKEAYEGMVDGRVSDINEVLRESTPQTKVQT